MENHYFIRAMKIFFLSVESISDKEKEKNRKTGGMQLVTVKYFQQVPQIPKQSMNA